MPRDKFGLKTTEPASSVLAQVFFVRVEGPCKYDIATLRPGEIMVVENHGEGVAEVMAPNGIRAFLQPGDCATYTQPVRA